MLRINLRKAVYFAVGQFPAQFFCQPFQVNDLFFAQGKPFLQIISPDIVDI